jgi:glutathione synthase/RimK-type ligase-like ATP-grasp enzyme
MNVDRCWGIFREPAHSPGRESDDAEILRLTAKELEARGFEVAVKDPAEIGHPAERRPGALFLMCEQVPVLRLLQEWEAGGVRLVNAPLAILNTYRECSLALLRSAGIPLPVSRVVATAGRPSGDREPGGPLWVKRADVHNTQADDVVCVQSAAALRNALAGLARRGIARAVLQEHIEGDLLKFYGIGTTAGPSGAEPWFRHFYHRDQDLRGYPFDPRVLAQVARCAALALGLEVFGGDAIVTPDGRLILIDLNAWPSFALYRDEAAAEIGRYLVRRFRPG